MKDIKLKIIDTSSFYQACQEGKGTSEYYRYNLMKPFEKMWQQLNVPFKAKAQGGYDVLLASEMLGIWTPRKDDSLIENKLRLLWETKIFEESHEVIQKGTNSLKEAGYDLLLEEITLAILLGDPENKLLAANKGYSGFGGIPGYILLIVDPNVYNKTRLKSALAHELHHTIRFIHHPFQYEKITVEDYLVIEGMAEVFAETLYGIEHRGPWIQEYDENKMMKALAIIKAGRKVKGFQQVSAYMYGDEVAEQQGFQPVGLPRNAGYTIGYFLVKEYLKNTGQTIAQATFETTLEIVKGSKFFE